MVVIFLQKMDMKSFVSQGMTCIIKQIHDHSLSEWTAAWNAEHKI